MQALFYSCDTPCKYTIACFTTVPLNYLSVEAICRLSRFKFLYVFLLWEEMHKPLSYKTQN